MESAQLSQEHMEEATGIRLALAMAILQFLHNLVVDMLPKPEGAIFPNLVLDTLLNLVVVFLLRSNMRAIRRCRCLASNGNSQQLAIANGIDAHEPLRSLLRVRIR